MYMHGIQQSRTALTGYFFRALIATGFVGLLALASCGGSGSSGSQSLSTSGTDTVSGNTGAATDTGAAMVTLTDAPGDFLSYMVNVVSLKLTRADGTVVETVPTATQVDFAQLVNLSEVISAENIPSGSYVSASLTLDYSNASLVVDNGAGGIAVSASNIIDGATNAPLVSPNNEITVSLQLPSNSPFVVTQGTIANLALDFNLAASNTVAPTTISSTTAASSVSVTVNPILTASLVPDASKQIQVRGPLVSVTNTSTATSYTVNVRPFFNGSGTQGQLVVNTTATTGFIVNGTAYTGTAGLTALSALDAGTMTSAVGSFDISTRIFTAATITAGTATTGSILDSVEGTVIARSGDALTISNGLISPRDNGAVAFSAMTTVTVAATTGVTEESQTGTFGPQDISVGQHGQFFGTLSTTTSGGSTLDATQGSAQLSSTTLSGVVISSTANTVTVTLESLDGQAAAALNFAGTGASTAQNASAAAYVVSVPASLLTTPPTAGSPIRFQGFVTPFGAAPPDFVALSLTNYVNTNSQLDLVWKKPGLTAPFVAPLSATNVVIAQSTLQTAAQDLVFLASQRFTPSTLTSGLTLVPNASATFTAYAIGHGSSNKIDTYTSFADLITALGTDLNGSTALLQIEANGPYDSATGVLSVNQLLVLLSD
jgi:hypothetical protein